ncbi:MAG: hypothetical protein AAFX39_01955 [Pseudomonadota bacterium]
MADILPFEARPKATADTETTAVPQGGAEIVILPVVRFERRIEVDDAQHLTADRDRA